MKLKYISYFLFRCNISYTIAFSYGYWYYVYFRKDMFRKNLVFISFFVIYISDASILNEIEIDVSRQNGNFISSLFIFNI